MLEFEKQNILSDILAYIAQSLDISPSDYERAKTSYEAIGKCLENGYEAGFYPGLSKKPKIYPQGSIRLGTIVKPLRECDDASYDVDLVCELPYENIAWSAKNAELIKRMVGDRLKADGVYKEKIKKEGKRCWTVEYAEENGIGFHIDVLPCVPDLVKGIQITNTNPGNPDTRLVFTETTIALTDKDDNRDPCYEWRSGNPYGYAKWFNERNTTFGQFSRLQKQKIFENSRSSQTKQLIYKSIAEVPDQLVRTPLQRTIQLLKRHRDIRFNSQNDSDSLGNPKFKPISMIITTLAAKLYEGENDVFTALMNIVSKLFQYAPLVENRFAFSNENITQHELIRRKDDDTWEIQNPVNPAENFADRWHEDDHACAKAFFRWLASLKRDLEAIIQIHSSDDLKRILSDQFGEHVINDVWHNCERKWGNQSKTLTITTPRTLSRFSVVHRQSPWWEVRPQYWVSITGIFSRDGFRPLPFTSDSQPLPKNCSLRFEARTNTPKPFTVYWQIVNTGEEAKAASGLRGGFYNSFIEKGVLFKKESTLYSGMHWIECFIVQHETCVARSGEFVVNIQ